MKRTMLLRGTTAARIAIGVALATFTRPLLRALLRDEEPTASHILFARTVGIRDVLFGLGCYMASLDGRDRSEARRWVKWWLANEVADVAAAAASHRQLGVGRAAAAAAAPLPFIAADAWVLRRRN